MTHYTELEQNPKFHTEAQKTKNSQSTSEKKRATLKIFIISDFKIDHEDTVTKTVHGTGIKSQRIHERGNLSTACREDSLSHKWCWKSCS